MGQRVMIAMMLVTDPDLLIADEPTSALDVTVQLEVLRILDELVAERGMGLIFISHDLKLVSSFCDRVLVMYAGRVVEEVEARRPATRRKHPYTQGLLRCLPTLDGRRAPAADPRTAIRPGRCDGCRCSTSENLSRRLRHRPPAGRRGQGRDLPRRAGRRPSGSSASPAPASRPCCARSAASRRSRAGAIQLDGREVPIAARQGLLPHRADGLPGPLRLAASAPHRRPASSPSRSRSTARGDAEARILAGAARRRPRPVLPLPLSAPALRRPAPARRHRPRADPAAEDPAARRADLGARRLGPGGDPQPARRAARASTG